MGERNLACRKGYWKVCSQGGGLWRGAGNGVRGVWCGYRDSGAAGRYNVPGVWLVRQTAQSITLPPPPSLCLSNRPNCSISATLTDTFNIQS